MGIKPTALHNIIWKEEMNIAFICEGMTDLRYFLPLYSGLNRHKIGINFYLYYTSSGKYNSVDLNFKRFLSILESADFSDIKISHAENIDSSMFFDILFTIENISDFNIKPGKQNKKSIKSSFNYEKRFCIQHGLDYFNFASESSDYIVTDKCYQDDLKNRFNSSSIVSKVPVSFWNIDDQINLIPKIFKDYMDKKSAFIFYPENGYHKEVLGIVNFLINKDYNIVIKQRRKNQGIPRPYYDHSNISVFFDDMWYPSEAVVLPAISTFAMGFGTSAYFDLIPVGIPYIDFALPEYSKNIQKYNGDESIPINRRGYVKPSSKIFSYIEEYTEDCFSEIERIEKDSPDRSFKDFNQYVDKFLKNLLKSY